MSIEIAEEYEEAAFKSKEQHMADYIKSMKALLDSNETPERNPCCENCAYIEQANKLADE